MAGEKAVEKTLASRAWKSLRDSHFPTATTSSLRLHIKWLDGGANRVGQQGWAKKWAKRVCQTDQTETKLTY